MVYQSPVHRTPLIDESLIDGEALRKMIETEYASAKITANQVETGAVIITGESARKENARMVLELLSGFAGDFVVSTAGPDLESVIAGQGKRSLGVFGGKWDCSREPGYRWRDDDMLSCLTAAKCGPGAVWTLEAVRLLWTAGENCLYQPQRRTDCAGLSSESCKRGTGICRDIE